MEFGSSGQRFWNHPHEYQGIAVPDLFPSSNSRYWGNKSGWGYIVHRITNRRENRQIGKFLCWLLGSSGLYGSQFFHQWTWMCTRLQTNAATHSFQKCVVVLALSRCTPRRSLALGHVPWWAATQWLWLQPFWFSGQPVVHRLQMEVYLLSQLSTRWEWPYIV